MGFGDFLEGKNNKIAIELFLIVCEISRKMLINSLKTLRFSLTVLLQLFVFFVKMLQRNRLKEDISFGKTHDFQISVNVSESQLCTFRKYCWVY